MGTLSQDAMVQGTKASAREEMTCASPGSGRRPSNCNDRVDDSSIPVGETQQPLVLADRLHRDVEQAGDICLGESRPHLRGPPLVGLVLLEDRLDEHLGVAAGGRQPSCQLVGVRAHAFNFFTLSAPAAVDADVSYASGC